MDVFGIIEKELKLHSAEIKNEIESLNISSGKIFRGENYNLFPYIMLDCPRLFSAESVCAFRTMFWWGHEFSFTLHIQGRALGIFRERIKNNISRLKATGTFICLNNTPWQYDFGENNYRLIEKIPEDELNKLIEGDFIKLSRKLEINKHELLAEYAVETFLMFKNIINLNKDF